MYYQYTQNNYKCTTMESLRKEVFTSWRSPKVIDQICTPDLASSLSKESYEEEITSGESNKL